MSDQPYFFPITGKLIHLLTAWIQDKKWDTNKISYLNLLLGFISPLPLLFHIHFPNSMLMIFSPVFFCLYVIFDYTISSLEVETHRRSSLNTVLPIPVAVLVFLWYEVVLLEVTYAYAELAFFRYLNVFILCCAVAALLLIYGYLKLQKQPLNVHRFAELLEQFGRENEKEAPLNYITLTFKVLKRDLFALILLILSLLNLYLLYSAAALASIGFFGFTVYTLLLMKLMDKPEDTSSDIKEKADDTFIDINGENGAMGV
jgi:hypothetical protein